jgi:hypothetical protein
MYKDLQARSEFLKQDDNFSLGKVTDISIIGIVNGVNSADPPVDIWTDGGIYVFLTAAETLKVFSSSTNDTSAGTGARTLIILGLDANFDTITEFVTLNGTTAVNTSQSFMRVNGVLCLSAGSGGENEGTISVTKGSDTNFIISKVMPTDGLSKSSIYTTRRNASFHFLSMSIQPLRSQGVLASAELIFRPIGAADPCWLSAFELGSTESGNPIDLKDFSRIDGPFDVKMQVRSVSANNVTIFSTLNIRESFRG